jgi:BetI-type transcriptional repressor, C-terminal
MLADALTREESEFHARVAERFAAVEGAPAKLRILLEECSTDYEINTWIKVWSLSPRDADAREVRQRFDNEFRGTIEELIVEGQRSGDFADLPAADVALTLAAIIDGFAVQATLHDVRVTSGYMLSAFVDAAELLLECSLPPGQVQPGGGGG